MANRLTRPARLAGACLRGLFSKRTYAIAAAAILFLLALLSLFLWQYRQSLVAEAQERSARYAYLLAEQTARTFQAVDLTLRGLEPLLAAAPLPDHAPAFEILLRRRVAELDFIRLIVVVDADGRALQTSDPDQDPPSTYADRTFFQIFMRDPSMRLLIGHSGLDRTGQEQPIPVARRLTLSDGRFGGLLVAEIEPRYFAEFYHDLNLGPHATVNLYQDNGRTLLASTAANPMPMASMQLARAEAGASSDDETPRFGPLTGDRMVAYRRTEGYPLVVSVGVDVRDLRARWWRIAGPAIGAAAAVFGLIIGLAVLLERQGEERARALQRAMMAQKLEAMGQMTASVSHDFRNLLTVMTATLRLLRKRGPDEKVFSAAEDAIGRGNLMIEQLLAFSRRQDLQVASADINELLSGLEDVLRHAAGTGIVLTLEQKPDLPLCRTDQSQFDAALMNLVVNARQAMPDGGRITIETRLKDRAGPADAPCVVLTVADTGCGIDEGTLKRVFEPFFTTKAESGTGLGLAQVYGFMRQIGGDVRVESRVGAGTTFSLLFPVVGADAPALETT